jgi:hypothetical protein
MPIEESIGAGSSGKEQFAGARKWLGAAVAANLAA